MYTKIKSCLENGNWWTISELSWSTGVPVNQIPEILKALNDNGHEVHSRAYAQNEYEYKIPVLHELEADNE